MTGFSALLARVGHVDRRMGCGDGESAGGEVLAEC